MPAVFFAMAAPPLSLTAALMLAVTAQVPWVLNHPLYVWLRTSDLGWLGVLAVIGTGIVSGVLVGVFVGRRSGEVALFEKGIAWLSPGDVPGAIPWENLEGFRDTPHPWVEVVDKRGRCRTIPTPAEADRERLLTVLAVRLPNLGLPFEERSRP
jgi:hypothetical protein